MASLVAVLLAFLISLTSGLPAAAHGAHMSADVTIRGKEATIQVLGEDGEVVEGLDVAVATGLPGKRPGKEVQFTEGPAGTHKGPIAVPSTPAYEVTVTVNMSGIILHGMLPAEATEGAVSLQIPLEEIIPEPGFSSETLLYLALVIVMITAVVAAYFRRRALHVTRGGSL